MKWSGVIPIEGAGPAAKVKKYSASSHGHSGGGSGRMVQPVRAVTQVDEDDDTGILFTPGTSESGEFQAMLQNAMEGNRRMRETAHSIMEMEGLLPDTGGTARAFGFYRGFVFRVN